jgi:hypothetical protein
LQASTYAKGKDWGHVDFLRIEVKMQDLTESLRSFF